MAKPDRLNFFFVFKCLVYLSQDSVVMLGFKNSDAITDRSTFFLLLI
jgi:hypothetical protein